MATVDARLTIGPIEEIVGTGDPNGSIVAPVGSTFTDRLTGTKYVLQPGDIWLGLN